MAIVESSTKTVVPRTKAGKAAAATTSEQHRKRAQKASVLLKHISDPTRLQVILMLSEGEKHVGALCDALNQSQPAVSHHLALMRHGGVIIPHRRGKNNFYTLSDKGDDLARVVRAIMA
jgi:DNA-binding transcriptional ArsR family regulator